MALAVAERLHEERGPLRFPEISTGSEPVVHEVDTKGSKFLHNPRAAELRWQISGANGIDIVQ